jgi:hypothetical protein
LQVATAGNPKEPNLPVGQGVLMLKEFQHRLWISARIPLGFSHGHNLPDRHPSDQTVDRGVNPLYSD